MKKLILALLMALPMTMFAQKIGHVNIDAVAQAMPETAALQTEIQNLQKQFQDEMQRKQTDIQAKADAYEKEKATLSETLRSYREQELQKAYEEYQQFAQRSDQELQKTYNDKMSEIQAKVLKAVEEVASAGGFTYVIPAGALAYIGSGATDLTDQVKAKLGAK